MGSSLAIGGGLRSGQLKRFGMLLFLAVNSAWHPTSIVLLEGMMTFAGSMRFITNHSGIMCFQPSYPL